MGKTRVYEVAEAVGLDKKELVGKINGMDLGIEVKNYMSALTDEEAALVQSTIEREKRRQVITSEERIRPTVIRRRSRKKKEEPAEPEAEAEEAVEAEAATPAEEQELQVVEPTPDLVPETEPEEVSAEEDEPAEEPEAALAEAEAPADAEAEAAPAEAEEAEAPVEAAPVEAAPEEPAEAAAPEAPASVEPPQITEQKANQPSNIKGFIDPEVIRKRLAKDNKTFTPGPNRSSRTRSNSPRRKVVSQRDLYGGRGQRRRRRSKSSRSRKQETGERTQITQAAEHKRVLRIADAITVGDLSHEMGVKSSELIKLAMGLGMMMTVNHPVDVETAELLASEFGFTVEDVSFKEEDYIQEIEDEVEDLELRAPVVTVMGHVDHGKTSLLDAIRQSSVIEDEAGGITQHIGASTVYFEDGGKIVFLDTPGHEAFTALRQRGAKVTDLVVLVVAADDGVMPQTVEAINHARAAEVPIIVAVNKIDKPGANAERVKQALTEYELVPEEWGGSTIVVEVSALQSTNIDSLLEMIELQSELLELKANPDKRARGVVLEAFKDTGRGTVANLIVQEGTLHNGDIVVSGASYGRVRSLSTEHGEDVEVAGPATPIEITGLSDVPEAGEIFFVAEDEKTAKEFTDEIAARRRQVELAARKVDPWAALKEGKTLNIIVKADVQGSVEALEQSLEKLSTDEVEVKVIHSGAGGITESDVQLAIASEALVVGFNVRPEARANEIAKREGVQIELHSVIYDVIDRIKGAMTGLLDPVYQESPLGEAEVRETFSVPRVGTVAGCYVVDGKVVRNASARLIRDSKVIAESKIGTLRRFKDDVKEVKSGFECGLSLATYNDIKIGDRIEVFETVQVEATLD